MTTEAYVANKMVVAVDRSIRMAVTGTVYEPQPGVDYLPKTVAEAKEFLAHPWVRNAVLLAVVEGAYQASTDPDFRANASDLRLAALTVGLGADLYECFKEMSQS